jgi:hypothetical protein
MLHRDTQFIYPDFSAHLTALAATEIAELQAELGADIETAE